MPHPSDRPVHDHRCPHCGSATLASASPPHRAVYNPARLAELIATDPARAAVLLRAIDEVALAAQAAAHAAYLRRHHLHPAPSDVLAAWQTMLLPLPSPADPPIDCALLADLLQQPGVGAAILNSMSPEERDVQAAAMVEWLAELGVSVTAEALTSTWTQLLAETSLAA